MNYHPHLERICRMSPFCTHREDLCSLFSRTRLQACDCVTVSSGEHSTGASVSQPWSWMVSAELQDSAHRCPSAPNDEEEFSLRLGCRKLLLNSPLLSFGNSSSCSIRTWLWPLPSPPFPPSSLLQKDQLSSSGDFICSFVFCDPFSRQCVQLWI